MIDLPDTDARYIALKADDAVALALLEISFPSAAGGTKRMTDGPRNVTVNRKTYRAHQGLAGVSPVAPQDASDRHLLEIQLWDPDPGPASWHTRFTSRGYAGIRVELAAAFVAADGSLSLPLSAYVGKCIGEKLGWKDGRVVVARFAGAFARRSGNPVVATDAAQRGRLATDKSLKFISVARNIEWGRKRPKGWRGSHPEAD